MAAPPPVERVLHLGFRFDPSPLEAATFHVPRLIAGAPVHPAFRPFLHDTDVYACEPGVLARQFRPTPKKDDRFFFTTVKRQKQKAGKDVRYVRAAGPGSWSLQRSTDVMDGDVKVGEVRKLKYKCKKGGGASADWLMDECACCCVEGAVAGDTERVLCRVYVSPNAKPDSATRQESAAFFARPEPVVVAHAAAPKRPAPQLAEPPCPKRIRGDVVAPFPPVLQPAGCTTPVAPVLQPCLPGRGMAPMVQPGRSPVPAPPRPCAPSQQQATLPTASVARVSASARHFPPRPSVLTALVAQAPLTPRPAPRLPVPFASPDAQDASAAGEDDLDGLVNDIEGSLEVEEETAAHRSSTAGADDDDTRQFASSLEDLLDPQQEVHMEQKQVYKERDPFAAAAAREAEFMCA